MVFIWYLYGIYFGGRTMELQTNIELWDMCFYQILLIQSFFDISFALQDFGQTFARQNEKSSQEQIPTAFN